MSIIDVLNSPWAIRKEKLRQITAIYKAHASGKKLDAEAIQAQLGTSRPAPKTSPYDVTPEGVAILPVVGLIAKRMSLMTQICGGVSTQIFESDLQTALDDPVVRAILLLVDSPGGAVDGTQAAAHAVRAAALQKPMATLADGEICSAAYWIGSATGNVYLADDTTFAGSIGVVVEHEDWSKYEENLGVKVTDITAGKYKRIASEHEPLSQEGRATIEDQLDHIYTVFVDEVAQNLGTDPETVLSQMADGRVFLGQQAISAGLAIAIKSQPDVLALLSARADAMESGAQAPSMKGASMDKVTVCGVECATQEAVNTAVQSAIAQASQKAVAEAQAKAAAELQAKTLEAATNERERILAVEANAMPGHEKLIAEMKADGKTTGPEAAQRILSAEKARLAQINHDMQAGAPPAAPASERHDKPAEQNQANPQELAKAARQYQVEQAKAGVKISATEAVKHVFSLQK